MDIFGRRYELKRDESELKKIEKDLAQYLGVPFVRCAYDCVYSHKYRDKNEEKIRKEMGDDYIINYEIFDSKEDYEDNYACGIDGEVNEIYYLLCNGRTYNGREIIISGL